MDTMFNNFTEGLTDDEIRHQLIRTINNLTKKYDDISNTYMLDYFLAGGNPDFRCTINFIDKSDLCMEHPSIRKIRGKIRTFDNMVRITCSTYDGIKRSKYIIKGHQLTDDEKQNILDYIERKGFPLYHILFNDIAREYVYGNINVIE